MDFVALKKIKIPKVTKILPNIFFTILALLVLFLVFTPWIQTSKGFGYIIAIDPNDRTQTINATVTGRINKWYVRDGMSVKKGDKLVEIIDNDPLILQRVEAERNAKKRKLEISEIASQTAEINYRRQEDLFNQGLSSRKEFEKAKIEYKKLLSEAQSVSAELAEAEVKLSRQESQVIYAPKDGAILKLLAGDSTTLVKAGDKIATFAPILDEPAVELYVSGNDIPLIHKGRKVRLQFEGWPAVQFSGWPEVAIGTFGGVVTAIDASVSENGKFRVIVSKEAGEKWPDARFLRHHAKVYGWVLLNEVMLGYELWRQMNNFPPEFDEVRK
jgi:RND family efflux transporter MFP subunit